MHKHQPNPSTQIDTLFTCLSDPHRRLIIRTLSDDSTPIALETLSQRIVEHRTAISEEEPQEIAIDLYHRHLPKLEEADLVDVDSEFNAIQEGDRFERAESLLDEVAEYE